MLYILMSCELYCLKIFPLIFVFICSLYWLTLLLFKKCLVWSNLICLFIIILYLILLRPSPKKSLLLPCSEVFFFFILSSSRLTGLDLILKVYNPLWVVFFNQWQMSLVSFSFVWLCKFINIVYWNDCCFSNLC